VPGENSKEMAEAVLHDLPSISQTWNECAGAAEKQKENHYMLRVRQYYARSL
jgi:hypothetical protein